MKKSGQSTFPAGIVVGDRGHATYPWSSYRATGGLVPLAACISIDWVLSQFGKQRQSAQQKYRAFVAEGSGQEAPWEAVQGQVLLGSEHFFQRLTAAPDKKHPFTEIPRQQRFAGRPTLLQLFPPKVRGRPHAPQLGHSTGASGLRLQADGDWACGGRSLFDNQPQCESEGQK